MVAQLGFAEVQKKNIGNNIDVVHKKFLREIFKGTRITLISRIQSL